MPPLDAIIAYFAASWRIMKSAKPEALSDFDLTAHGFWQSFWALGVALIPSIFTWITAAQNYTFTDRPPDRLQIIARIGLGDIVAWIAPLIVFVLIAKLLGLQNKVSAYVIVSNWASAFFSWLFLPFSLIRLTFPTGQNLEEFLFLITLIASVFLGWRLNHGILNRGAILTTGICILNFIVAMAAFQMVLSIFKLTFIYQ